MYRNRESAGCFNTTNFLAKMKAYQDTRPERVWVADTQRKYLRPYEDNGTETYIDMLAGRKTHQREQVKTYNGWYYASKYVSDLCTANNIMVRGNTPTTWQGVAPANTATLSMYINCYIVVASTSYNVVAKTKATRGQTYVMDFSTIGSMGETELYFCSAPMITELSGLAHLYFKQNNFTMATNLQRLEIGSNVTGYTNTNLESLTIGNSRMLEYLDVRNCPNVTGALDLSGCVSLSEVYLDNTSFTGITFATGGLLETAHLPEPTSITMRELIYLQDLSLESTNNITTLRVEDCEFDPTTTLTIGATSTTQATKDIVLNLVDSSNNLSRVRFIGIDWVVPGTTVLNRLLAMAGINDDSYDVTQSVLTGEVYIDGTSRIREINNYRSTWQYLDVTYNPSYVVEQYLATYVNDDDTELCQIYVDRGTLPPDPVATGVIETPTKASTAQYTFAFSGWEDIQSVMTGNRTIVAQYTPTVRTYTVTWYAREAVPIATTQAAYGSEVVYNGNLPTRTEDEDSLRYYVFLGWDKSTGYITGDTNVYALWDDKYLPVVGSKDISDMSVAEIYGLGQAANRNSNPINIAQYVDNKDYVDIVAGNDFNFSNVESALLCQNRWFNGVNDYLDTNIKLFDEDSPSFTLAVDYEFYTNTNNSTLVACYDENNDDGFRMRYSNNPSIQWGDKTATIGYGGNRAMCVIRHQKGSSKLFVYSSNTSADRLDSNISSYELTRTRNTQTDMTLIFGAIKIVAGSETAYDLFASGWIHWAKIWYDDLGAANATELAQWPHETWRAQFYGVHNGSVINRYRIQDSVKYAKLPFILNNLLMHTGQISNTSDNLGGWPNMTMPTLLNNRIYKALPTGWRSILKRVRVMSGAGHASQEIVNSDDRIFIPSYSEVYSTSAEPYISEGSHIDWFVDDYTRLKFRGLIIPDDSRLFRSSSDPSSSDSNNVKQGDIWFNNSNSSALYYVPQSVASKHRRMADNGYGAITAADGGTWIRSDYWWTRSPSTQQEQCNVYVSETGHAGFPGWVTTDYCIDVCFAV